MTNKTTMPDPVGEVKVDQLGNTKETISAWHLNPGHYYLITTDQAEAYAAAKVREAMEEAAEVADRHNAFATYDAIRALIPKEIT